MTTLIVGLLVALLVFLAARSVVRQSKTGGCSGCSGCSGCGGSCGCHTDTPPEEQTRYPFSSTPPAHCAGRLLRVCNRSRTDGVRHRLGRKVVFLW